MNPTVVIVVVVVVVAAIVAAVVVGRRNEPDTLDSFRRQIDALSPEARRGVVDQVHRFDQSGDSPAAPGDGSPEAASQPPAGDDGGADRGA